MYRLLYISSSRAPISTAENDAILRASRRNNAADGVTGLLVTGGRRFLQVLEGERDVVERTYARIVSDPRHYALVRLAGGEVPSRQFGEWAMGHAAGGAGRTVSELTAPLSDPSLRAYFDGFVDVHAAA